MKRAGILLTVFAVTVLCGGYGAKAQEQAQMQNEVPSKRHLYFSEGFSGTNPRYDTTYWNLAADTGYRRLLYSSITEAGGRAPEAVWGYAPSSGLNEILRDTIRLVSKPFELQSASRSYLSMKYLYQSSKSSAEGIRSFGLAVRKPGEAWVQCAIVGNDGLTIRMGPERLTAELPVGFNGGTEVEVCVYLQNRADFSELKNNYMLYFDDIEFYAYPEAYHELAFSWSGCPFEFTGFTIDTVDFIVNAENDTVGVVTDTVFDALAVGLQMENIGNTLTSCKVAYTFDGGAVQYLDLTFENPLLPGQTHTVTGFEPAGWAEAAEGHHALVFWLAEADGVALAETEVVKQRKFISKVNAETLTTYAYKPLVEEFSSSSCSTCAPRNKSLQPVFNELGYRISVVKYQMYFPGKGDPYFTGDGGQRKIFYDIKNVPEIYLNGQKDPTSGGAEGMRIRFMEKIDAPAFFDVAFDTLALDADTNIYIALKVRSSLPMGNVRLQTVVLEKQTEGNASTNGETEFHHVMLKMLPDGQGLTVDLDPDSVYTFRYAYGMNKTFMEDAGDLAVVCFLQADNDTVLQSAIGDVTMRIDKAPVANERAEAYTRLTVYPNPASEEVMLPALNAATVEVFDMGGYRVFHRYGVQGDYRLDVRNFRPGIYVIRVVEANRTAWSKISVVR